MQAVRNGLVILLLAGVGYAVYTYVNKPAPTPPPGADMSMPAVTVQAGPTQPGGAGGLASPFSEPGGAAPSAVVPRTKGMALEDAPAYTPRAVSANAPAPASAAAIPPLPNSPVFEPPAELKKPAPAPTSAIVEAPAARKATATAPSTSIEAPPRAGKDVTATSGKFTDAWMDAQRALAADRLVEAHALLTAWYAHPNLTSEEDAKLTELLGQLAGSVIYSNTDHLLQPAYVVGANETLDDIAKKHNVPWQLLAKINGRADASAVRPGDRIKVVRGPFDAVVDLRRKEVALQLNGHYAGRFAIVRSGVDASKIASAAAGLAVKEKMNVNGEHYVGLADAENGAKLGIYADDPSPSGLKMPAERSIVLSQRDATDLYDILMLHESTVAIAPP